MPKTALQPTDLTVEVFLALRKTFFDKRGAPVPFKLRDKLNTQDDPFDEFVHEILSRELHGVTCTKSPGPLITPDEVLYRPELCDKAPRADLRNDLRRIVGLESKKLLRGDTGSVARASGMDYNTTPPCGTVRVYDAQLLPLDIRGFYLFVCLEPVAGSAQKYRLTALVLCDGNALNDSFDLYLSIVGSREKRIGLGTYADGVNRQRPMLIFSNPLGCTELDHSATLIHPAGDLTKSCPDLRLVYRLTRTAKDGRHEFFCYRQSRDVPARGAVQELLDPFPTPTERKKETQGRGRFRVSIEPT